MWIFGFSVLTTASKIQTKNGPVSDKLHLTLDQSSRSKIERGLSHWRHDRTPLLEHTRLPSAPINTLPFSCCYSQAGIPRQPTRNRPLGEHEVAAQPVSKCHTACRVFLNIPG